MVEVFKTNIEDRALAEGGKSKPWRDIGELRLNEKSATSYCIDAISHHIEKLEASLSSHSNNSRRRKSNQASKSSKSLFLTSLKSGSPPSRFRFLEAYAYRATYATSTDAMTMPAIPPVERDSVLVSPVPRSPSGVLTLPGSVGEEIPSPSMVEG